MVASEARPRPPAASRPDRRLAAPTATLVGLVFVLALALGLRLSGLDWGLPWAFHPDEIFYVDQAEDILRFGEPNPKYFKNPSLLTYLIVGERALARALGPLAGSFDPDLPGSAYLTARLNGALLGTASVAVLFALGALLFGRRAGLLAALLLAVAFLHVRDSHYGVNDVPATFFLLLSLYGAARLAREPRLRWYVLAGLAGGLATSTKYNMGLFFVPILVAHWQARGEDGRRPPFGFLALAGGVSLLAYLAGTPYTLLDFRRFRQDFLIQYGYGEQRWLGQPLEPVPLLYLTTLLQGFGLLPLLLAAGGLIWALRTGPLAANAELSARLAPRAAAALLVAFPLAYLAFLMPKALFFPRFAIPLLPSLALLAAAGLAALAGRLPRRWRRAGLGALVGLTLLQPLGNSLLHNRLLLQPDTRVLANEWVQANLPPGSRVKVEDYSLRDLSTASRTYTPNVADLKIERFAGSPETERVSEFVEDDVQYIVTSSFAFDRYLLEPPLPRQRQTGERYQRLHRDLERRAELIATFGPGHGGQPLPYRQDDVFTPFWSLPDYARTGPTVRIYSLLHLADED